MVGKHTSKNSKKEVVRIRDRKARSEPETGKKDSKGEYFDVFSDSNSSF